jgi:hypothetical protein
MTLLERAAILAPTVVDNLALTRRQPEPELPFVGFAPPRVPAAAGEQASRERSFVDAAVRPLEAAAAVEFVIAEVAVVDAAAAQHFAPLAAAHPGDEFAFVHVAGRRLQAAAA